MLMATVAAVCCLGIFQTSVGHPTGYPTDTIRRQTQQTTGRGEEQPPPPPPQLVLFVDRAQIAAGADARLQLRLQPPAKDGAAVLRPDRPWEAWAIAAWATVVPGSGARPHRLYYDCVEAPRAPARLCLAESRDALTWTKPELGLYSFRNSTRNNIVLGAEGCSPFVEPTTHIGVAAARRWKMVCSNGEGTRGQAWTSPDGLKWSELPDSSALTFSDDTQPTMAWDAALKTYVIFVRRNVGAHDAGHRRHIGRCVTANLSNWQADSSAQTCDGSGPKPCGCPIVLGPDEIDPPNVDVYSSVHVAYPSADNPAAHLFFPSFFSHFEGNDKHGGPPNGLSNDGLLDTRMLVTRNLAAGNLSYAAGGSRSPFVPLGVNKCEGWTPSQSGGWCAPGDAGLSQTSIDTSTVWVAAGYIPSADGETLYMYYAGTPYTHAGGGDARHGWGNNTGIGLLKLRVDGFVALEAPYDFSQPRPSFATTAVWVPGCAGRSRNAAPHVLVNMVTGVAGYVAVAVEAADGNAPPAGAAQFGLTHANHLKGNAIAAVASWDRGADHRASSLSAWQGRQVRLRVEMVDAKLFSLRITCGPGEQ